jgi:hypothetical protein
MTQINAISTELKLNNQGIEFQTRMFEQRFGLLDERQTAMEGRQVGMGQRIGELENKPGKRWEHLWQSVLTSAATLLLGLLIGYVLR